MCSSSTSASPERPPRSWGLSWSAQVRAQRTQRGAPLAQLPLKFMGDAVRTMLAMQGAQAPCGCAGLQFLIWQCPGIYRDHKNSSGMESRWRSSCKLNEHVARFWKFWRIALLSKVTCQGRSTQPTQPTLWSLKYTVRRRPLRKQDRTAGMPPTKPKSIQGCAVRPNARWHWASGHSWRHRSGERGLDRIAPVSRRCSAESTMSMLPVTATAGNAD